MSTTVANVILYGFEIAIKNILPREQITDEYAIFNLEKPISLLCENPNCRKVVSPEDFDLYYKQWDGQIKQALYDMYQVGQPLFKLLDSKTRSELNLFFEDSKFYKSVFSLKYNEVIIDKTVQTTNGREEQISN